MTLLDTHAWVWWLSAPESLPEDARAAIGEARRHRRLLVSSISVWEVALLVSKGRLELTLPLEEWINKAEALPFLRFIPVDNAIALRSVKLPGSLHPDPADRIILATALEREAVLITKDERLGSYPHVKTIW